MMLLQSRKIESGRQNCSAWIVVLLLIGLVGGCVKSEDALDRSDAVAEPPVSNPTPPDDDMPADPPVEDPPVDPPVDEMPPPVDPDPPVEPPELTDVMLFEQTLYPALRDTDNFCAGCHGATQIPTFAVDDVMAAYNQLVGQQKVDLQNPANSRVYLRPAVDRHNCGGDANCDRVAAEFLAAIELWAGQANPTPPPVAPAVSAKTSFALAEEAAAARADANAVAKFVFAEGAGTSTVSVGSADTPITLTLEGTEWVDGGGLRITDGKAQASLADSLQLFAAINASKAYSVEAWVVPQDTAQDGPARIVSYSLNTGERNFTLGQNAIYYQLRNRSAGTDANGSPALEALDPEVSTEPTHVVATFDEASGRKIFLNGVLSLAEDTPDTLDWVDDQLLVFGNEVTGDRPWNGVLNLVAIHDKALTAAEVAQNYDAGLGDMVTLRFDISDALGMPGHIQMLAKAVDDKSYLFAEPTYVGDATDVKVKNIRVAVNDSVPVAAQSFRRVDVEAAQSNTLLSPLAAVVPVSEGIDSDQLHLEFEVIGALTGSTEPIAPPAPPAPAPDVEEPDFGVRSFSQVYDTMSELTGVDANQNAIRNLYDELRGQLPASNDLLSFSSSAQIAIQRLAVGYCDAVVSDGNQCDELFGNCSIDGNAKDQVGDALVDAFVGVDLATQPAKAAITAEVVSMINDLDCANGCDGAEGRTTLAAACSAVLASSAITLD